MEDVPIHYGGLVLTFNYFTLNQTIQCSQHTLKRFSIFRLQSAFSREEKSRYSLVAIEEEEKSPLPCLRTDFTGKTLMP